MTELAAIDVLIDPDEHAIERARAEDATTPKQGGSHAIPSPAAST